jgi:hypothetical protein
MRRWRHGLGTRVPGQPQGSIVPMATGGGSREYRVAAVGPKKDDAERRSWIRSRPEWKHFFRSSVRLSISFWR